MGLWQLRVCLYMLKRWPEVIFQCAESDVADLRGRYMPL